MDKEYIISAVGGNRPGVVEELAREIYLFGIKVENSSMTLLGGHFSLMIHVVAEEKIIRNDLADKLSMMEEQTEISTHVFSAPEKLPGAGEEDNPQYDLRVRGEDRSGILYKTASFLARRGVNILEMSTRVENSPQQDTPMFLMRTRIEVPREADSSAFFVNLEYLASELQESMTLTRVGRDE
ncbi:MAG: glycine cleavage system protein R [Desulfosudaceae bacterium]